MRSRTIVLAAVAVMSCTTAPPHTFTPNPRPQAPAVDSPAFPDVLDRHGSPLSAQPPEHDPINIFADHGSWHGYALPDHHHPDQYGAFTGPMYIAQEFPWYLSKAFTRVELADHATGKRIDLADDPSPGLHAYPGRLSQEYRVNGLRLSTTLRFVTDRTALVQARVDNTGSRARILDVHWSGALLRPEKEPMRSAPALSAAADGVQVDFAKVREPRDYLTSGAESFRVNHADAVSTTVRGDSYVTSRRAPLRLDPGSGQDLYWTETYNLTEGERAAREAELRTVLTRPWQAIRDSETRWGGYLAGALRGVAPSHRQLAVKAVETLVGNWRGAAGRLHHAGITPSVTFRWFVGGYWPWDSFKEAVGVARFSPELAQSVIRAQFEHQITGDSPTQSQDAGMLPDVVAYNNADEGGLHWSDRNTKPPMASWAVWETFRATHDVAFLHEMYGKLVAYHDWWCRNRDFDHDGLAEYGATAQPANATPGAALTAAAWESGMDDAPRFDPDTGIAVLENRDPSGRLIGYSLNQESVDLNAYLVAEKRYLGEIARVLGRHADAQRFDDQAQSVSQTIRTRMYDAKSGYFYDVSADTDTPLVRRGKGTEGVIPLWTGVASPAQADAVRAAMLDPNQFATTIPFPTVPKNSPDFDPTRYWRGTSWVDQVWFGTTALDRYGHHTDAERLRAGFLQRAQGLTHDDAPIRENYNSITGAGMNATNFSWSAALLLVMLGQESTR